MSGSDRVKPIRNRSSLIQYRLRKTPVDVNRFYTLVLFLVFCVFPIVAQTDEDFFPEFRPTPKIEISEDEKKALEAEKDIKKFTGLVIDLMETRLKKAEDLTTRESFREMLEELGGFHALMNLAIESLTKKNVRRGKMLDNLKRFEMALRAFTPRIELIRRESPERFDAYIFKLLRSLRATRARAIESFYTDTVVPN